jgi:putative methyltransferase (TIGR04325 family)
MRAPEFEYVAEGWNRHQTDSDIKGWNRASIVNAYLRRWPDFLETLSGPKPLGIAPEAVTADNNDIFAHNIIMTFAYVLALTAHNRSRISILDWGSSIGHYLPISKALLPGIEIDYTCKDLPVFAEQGQKLLPEATFCADDSWQDRHYDLVFASASLQYSQDWRTDLQLLAQAAEQYVFITRLPIVQTASFVVMQRPRAYGYDSHYLGWYLNRNEFLDCAAKSGLTLIREFVTHPRIPVHNAPEDGSYRGFLFKVTAPAQ